MVLVVRRDLQMGRGKTAAQCCHACLGLYKKLRHRKDPAVREWEASGATKVCLRVESEAELLALQKAAAAAGVATHMVVDAGRTQVAPDSRTVLALLADGAGVDGVTGELKLL
jgi:peptidyl-tRNA hydrolase